MRAIRVLFTHQGELLRRLRELLQGRDQLLAFHCRINMHCSVDHNDFQLPVVLIMEPALVTMARALSLASLAISEAQLTLHV